MTSTLRFSVPKAVLIIFVLVLAIVACRCDLTIADQCFEDGLAPLPSGGLGVPDFLPCADALDYTCPVPVNAADEPEYQACLEAASQAFHYGQPTPTHSYQGVPPNEQGSIPLTELGENTNAAEPTAMPPQPMNCSLLRLTSPLDGLPDGEVIFYWDPIPGSHKYRIRVYDAATDALLYTLIDTTGLSSTRADVSQAAIGGGYQLRVTIEASSTSSSNDFSCLDSHLINRAAPFGGAGNTNNFAPPTLQVPTVEPTPEPPR